MVLGKYGYGKKIAGRILGVVMTGCMLLTSGCGAGNGIGNPAGISAPVTPVTREYISELEQTMEYPVLDSSGQGTSDTLILPESCYSSKKGLQVNELIMEDAIDLGIGWGFVNFYFNELLSATPTEYEYTYKGRTIYFDKKSLETSDYMISRMSEEGIKVMAAVVNSYKEEMPELRYPGIEYNPGTQYYAFNVKTQEGRDLIEGVMCFLLERYDGEEYGFVKDWLVGNEVNDNLQYNYIGPCDGETYVAEYYEQFKFFYNIIRRFNPSANVYIPMEHRWNTANTMTDYGGKWFLEYFHECELKDQEMDWGLAWHPYPYPLGDADTLDDGDEPTTDTDGQPTYGGEVTMEYTSPLVSMKNIHVITDYLSENLLTSDGRVRSIICSEVGYTSFSVLYGENQSKQAANIAFALVKAQMNPYIDAFIIRCQLDISEGSPYFQFGLREDAEGRYLDKKLAFDVFRYLDTTEAEQHIDEYLPVLGINGWSDVIEGYDPAVFEGMNDYSDGKILRMTDDRELSYVDVTGAYEDRNYDDMMYRCYFINPDTLSGDDIPDSDTLSGDEDSDVDILSQDDLDLSECSAVGFEINERSGAASGRLKVRIRIRSGRHILEAEGVLNPSEQERFLLPVSDWEYFADADNIELWLNDADTELKYSAEYEVKGFLLNKDEDPYDSGICEDITLTRAPGKSVEELKYSDVPDLAYTGYHQRPVVTVKDGEEVLTDGVDYCLSYANDKAAGVASVVIQGIGRYEGTHVINYDIECDFGDVFDPVYYLEHNPDVRDIYGDDPVMAQEHFVTHGMSEARQGCRDFDPMFYMENYPDLRECYGDDYLKYYLHYKNVGKAEGRVADRLLNNASYMGVDYTAVYDAAYYASNNYALFESLDRNEWKLIRYFVENGMSEGARGSEEFDVHQYVKAHPDLFLQYGTDLRSYYMHYLEEGASAGESGTPDDDPVWSADNPLVYRGRDLKDVYDPVYYASHYDDAALLADDPEALIRHFVIYGMKEGRRGSYEFDPKLYLARYSDVRAAYRNLVGMAYNNYINEGKEAGR